ncbi:MAG: DNA repair exonuclease [Candidatus Bathyarchaeia archaeon]
MILRDFSFIHAADTHLGYEQYNLSERRDDFDNAFSELVERALELKPSFIIIAGDLFHHARPSNITLERAIRNFRRLKDANIPVLVVDGSHDHAPNIVTGTILTPLDSAGLIYYLPRHEDACWENDCCYVYGIPNFRTRERFEEKISSFYGLKRPAPRKNKFNIFVFHMTLDAPEINSIFPRIAAETGLKLIPSGFNYYAGGHIHAPIHFRLRDSIVAYSGSTENVSYEDAAFTKGFYYVEIDRDIEAHINYIKFERTRKFKVLEGDYSGLQPNDIVETVVKTIREADEDGAVIVPVLRGILPAGVSKREINLAKIRNAAEKALIVHPVMLLRETEFSEEISRDIFDTDMKDLKTKSYEYFLQFFTQRNYGREEAERRASAALDLIQYLVKDDEVKVRKILEELFR